MLVTTALLMLPQFGTPPKRLGPLPEAKVTVAAPAPTKAQQTPLAPTKAQQHAPPMKPQPALPPSPPTGPKARLIPDVRGSGHAQGKSGRLAKAKPIETKPLEAGLPPKLHETTLPPLSPLPGAQPGERPALTDPTELHGEGQGHEGTAQGHPVDPHTGDEAKADDDPGSDAQAEIRDAHASPATHYGKLTQAQCMHEARHRNLPLEQVGEARGVLAPVRLRGALHGVTYRSAMREAERKTSVFEIFDCRLVLALDDLAHTLAKHDIVEVIHMSAYRPPAAKYWKDGQLGTRHSGALALDAGTFVKKDGTKLNVERDFHGAIGQKACPAPQGNELRALACEMIDQNLFHVFLTPGFNWAHRNHFHIEVAAKGNHFYIR